NEHGAETPFVRPAGLADDYATTMDVMAHAVGWLQETAALPGAVCCIYATAPFMSPDDLRRGLAIFQSGQWQFVFAATTYAFPIFRAFGRHEQGGLKMFFPGHFTTRSQDLPEALHD